MTRRMWEPKITNDGDFIELSHSAQVLYWRIMENADDDGVTGSLKPLLRLYDIGPDALQELLDMGYIIRVKREFVVRHWFVHNHFRKETYTPSVRKALDYLNVPSDSRKRNGWVYSIKPDDLKALQPLQNVDDYYPEHNNGASMVQQCNKNGADMVQQCATVSKISKISKLSKDKLSKVSKVREFSQSRQPETTTSSSLGGAGAAARHEKDTPNDKTNDQNENGNDKEEIKPAIKNEVVELSDSQGIDYEEGRKLAEDFLQRPLQTEEKPIVLNLIAKYGERFFQVLKASLYYMRENPEEDFTRTLESLKRLLDRRPDDAHNQEP